MSRRLEQRRSDPLWRVVLELVGFATVCAGMFLVHLAAGLVVTGLVLVLVANSRA